MTITLKDVSKSYSGQPVVQHVTACLQGRIVLVGASGSGKSTLCRLLLGLERPDSGTIQVQGHLVAVFQEDRLCPGLSAMENVALVCPRGFDRQQIEQGFQRLGLTAKEWNKRCDQLSGGQKRRTAILRAMLAPADGILLDEPFKGLDPQTKQAAMQYVLSQAQNRLLLLITHDKEEAEFFGPIKMHLTQSGLEQIGME